jgi:hypothetical protein
MEYKPPTYKGCQDVNQTILAILLLSAVFSCSTLLYFLQVWPKRHRQKNKNSGCHLRRPVTFNVFPRSIIDRLRQSFEA